jgi:(p)ppGpp synthase/HD superfamily hydrolase
MILLATIAHQGQFDKGGHPYILHPLKVMHYLKSSDEELNCMAVGHDLVEDTWVTENHLVDHGFTPRIITGIIGLTNVDGETEDEKFLRLTRNVDIARVKMCDLRHNTDVRRLKGVTQKDVDRMVRYHNLYLKLEAFVKANS